MALLSRAFVRKRMISLATTASVAAMSIVSAQDPAKTHHVRHRMQYVADQQVEQTFPSWSAAMHRTAIKPIPDIDREFVEMLVPRQGAVEMARGNSDTAVTGGYRNESSLMAARQG